jgi:hypothetical protein
VSLRRLSVLCASLLASACSPETSDIAVIKSGGTSSSSGTTTTTTSSTSTGPSEEHIAEAEGATLKSLVTFLWNRDIVSSVSGGSFDVSGACLLRGSYSAKGTASSSGTGCEGSLTAEIDFDFSDCEHAAWIEGETVAFAGPLHQKFSASYAGSCEDAQSSYSTLSSAALDVTFSAASKGAEPVSASHPKCTVELDYTMNKPNDIARLDGRMCGTPVQIDYD